MDVDDGTNPEERPGQTTRLEQTRSSAAASPAPRTPARWDRGGPAEPRERDLHGVRLAQVLRDRRVNLSRNPERGEARFPECVEDGAVRTGLPTRRRDCLRPRWLQSRGRAVPYRAGAATDRRRLRSGQWRHLSDSSGHKPPPQGDDSVTLFEAPGRHSREPAVTSDTSGRRHWTFDRSAVPIRPRWPRVERCVDVADSERTEMSTCAGCTSSPSHAGRQRRPLPRTRTRTRLNRTKLARPSETKPAIPRASCAVTATRVPLGASFRAHERVPRRGRALPLRPLKSLCGARKGLPGNARSRAYRRLCSM